MTPEQFQAIATDPAVFQEEVILPGVDGEARFGDIMADFQRERFAAINPALVAIANGKRPEIGRHFWEATKGCSKDTDLAICLLWLLAFSGRPLVCQVGAADQDQADELRLAAKAIVGLNPWLAEVISVQASEIVCKRTDSTCTIVPADVAGSHGSRPDVLIINELSHITRREAAENWRDNAAKVNRGLVVIATNAGLENTWQFDWREEARTSDRWFFHQWAKPSPWIDPAEVAESERRNSRARHLRLFWGVWARGVGDALDPDRIDARIVLAGPADCTPEGWVTIGGLDLGVKKDHSAFVVVGINGTARRISLFNCQSWAPLGGQVQLPEVRAAIAAANRRYGLKEVWFDPSQALLMAQDLQLEEAIYMRERVFSGANLNAMATALLEVFRGGTIDLFNDAQLIDDLKRLNIVERQFGMKLEAPADTTRGHCDRALALAITLPAAIEATKRSTEPEIIYGGLTLCPLDGSDPSTPVPGWTHTARGRRNQSWFV